MIECRQNRECQGLGLGNFLLFLLIPFTNLLKADYLIKPVQRLCKYPLLFKELRKFLLPDDPQLPILNEVISEVEKFAEIANTNVCLVIFNL
jgi:hypothetical protein